MERRIPVEVIGAINDVYEGNKEKAAKPPVKRRVKSDTSPGGSKRTSLLITHEDGSTEWQNTETLLVTSKPEDSAVNDLTIEEIGQDTLNRLDKKQQNITKNGDMSPNISKVNVRESYSSSQALSPEIITVDIHKAERDVADAPFLRETDAFSPLLEINTLPNSPSPTPTPTQVLTEKEILLDETYSPKIFINLESDGYQSKIHETPFVQPYPLDIDALSMCSTPPPYPESLGTPTKIEENHSPGPSFAAARKFFVVETEQAKKSINPCSSEESSLSNFPIPSPIPPHSRSISESSWTPDPDSSANLTESTGLSHNPFIPDHWKNNEPPITQENFVNFDSNMKIQPDLKEPNIPTTNQSHCFEFGDDKDIKDSSFLVKKEEAENVQKNNVIHSSIVEDLSSSQENEQNQEVLSIPIRFENNQQSSHSTCKNNGFENRNKVKNEIAVSQNNEPENAKKFITESYPTEEKQCFVSHSVGQSREKDNVNLNKNENRKDSTPMTNDNSQIHQNVHIVPISLPDGKVIKQPEKIEYDELIGEAFKGENMNMAWENMKETNIIETEKSEAVSAEKEGFTDISLNIVAKQIPIIIEDLKMEPNIERDMGKQLFPEPPVARANISNTDNSANARQTEKLLATNSQQKKHPTEGKFKENSMTNYTDTHKKSIDSNGKIEKQKTDICSKNKTNGQYSDDKNCQRENKNNFASYPAKTEVVNIPIVVESKRKDSNTSSIPILNTQKVTESARKMSVENKAVQVSDVPGDLDQGHGCSQADEARKTSTMRGATSRREKYATNKPSVRSSSVDTNNRAQVRSGSSQPSTKYPHVMSNERSLKDIDKDIETIWKELKGLERLPVSSEQKVDTFNKTSGPLPELLTWKSTKKESEGQGRTTSPDPYQTKSHRRYSSWDQSSAGAAPTTNTGPTHYSFVPKTAETKPGFITPTYLTSVNRVSRPATRSIPIQRQSPSLNSDRTKQCSEEKMKRDDAVSNNFTKISSPNEANRIEEGSTKHQIRSSPIIDHRRRESSHEIVHKRRSEEFFGSPIGKCPINSEKRQESSHQSSRITSSSSNSLKSCLKPDSRSNSLTRPQKTGSPQIGRNVGVNFKAHPQSRKSSSSPDKTFEWVESQRKEGEKKEGTLKASKKVSDQNTFENKPQARSSLNGSVTRNIPITLVSENWEKKGEDCEKPKKESENVLVKENDEKPADVIRGDAYTQTDISCKNKNCCIM